METAVHTCDLLHEDVLTSEAVWVKETKIHASTLNGREGGEGVGRGGERERERILLGNCTCYNNSLKRK